MGYKDYFTAAVHRFLGDGPKTAKSFADVDLVWMAYDVFNPETRLYNDVSIAAIREKNPDPMHGWVITLQLGPCRNSKLTRVIPPLDCNLEQLNENLGKGKADYFSYLGLQRKENDKVVEYSSTEPLTAQRMIEVMESLDRLFLQEPETSDRHKPSCHGIQYEPRGAGYSLDSAVKILRRDNALQENAGRPYQATLRPPIQ